MYKVIRSLLKPIWTGKQQRYVIAKVAKALVDECWYYVGASTRKNAIIRVLNGEAFVELVDFVPVTEVYVPVSSVASEVAGLIPIVGCDPDAVARAVAIKSWKLVQTSYVYKNPVLTAPSKPQATKPHSLFDYCED